MKTYGVVEVQLYAFLTSALNGAERSDSTPNAHWAGITVGPQNRSRYCAPPPPEKIPTLLLAIEVEPFSQLLYSLCYKMLRECKVKSDLNFKWSNVPPFSVGIDMHTPYRVPESNEKLFSNSYEKYLI